jgi:hypothetical protein
MSIVKYQYFIIFIGFLFTFNIYGNDLVLEYVDIAGIQFKVIKNGESNRRFIWIHGDEKTAAMLLKRHLKYNYGTAFLIENHKREVFINGYMMDPNRIFSKAGAEKNLIEFNGNISKMAVDKMVNLIANDKGKFFDRITPPNGGLLIALHNNLHAYSIDDEIPISTEISLKNSEHPHHHNFFICTNRDDYNLLSKSPFNVVLQETQPKKDNGSLSWFVARKGVRFINIETRLGYLSIQAKMLQYIEDHLD